MKIKNKYWTNEIDTEEDITSLATDISMNLDLAREHLEQDFDGSWFCEKYDNEDGQCSYCLEAEQILFKKGEW